MRSATLLVPGSILLAFGLAVAEPQSPAAPAGLKLVPEGERPYRRLVIGLDPLLSSPFMLPQGSVFEGLGDRKLALIRRQLYWLNFELMHGQIVNSIPKRTHLFVAVPDPRLHPRELGDEREEFREYLKVRARWTPAEIADRVRFFVVGRAVPFPQDIAEPLGTDKEGRLVLGIGAEADLFYRETLQHMVRAFPKEFAMYSLPGVNTEGGDVELVRLPDGKIGLIAGHHRVLRWLEYRYGEGVLGRAIPTARIEEVRTAFQKAFFGLDVLFVNEEGLRSPSLTSDELFHSDMILNVARGPKGPVAFVPSYEGAPVDAISREPISPEVRRRAQLIYDRVAKQLAGWGFHVARLPFADHPVRNPVNVGKYTEPTGEQVVLLGKYPYHFALPDGPNPQRELQKRFDELSDDLEAWRNKPSDAAFERVKKRFQEVWAEMDRAAASPNPTFDRQAKVYQAEGVRVVPVPIFPMGEGGLHCLGLAEQKAESPEAGERLAYARAPVRRSQASKSLSR